MKNLLKIYLFYRFKCRTLLELNDLIEWHRASAIANKIKLKPEFVLDNHGNAPDLSTGILDYPRFFSAYDVNQGWIGNCFHLSAIVGRMNNLDLLKIVIPKDNTDLVSIEKGVYHFRFWRLGYWHDVVVDEELPVGGKTDRLVFSFNAMFGNEFWVPLFEKALAKFLGSYDELEAGGFENSVMFVSGGLHEDYLIEKCVSIKDCDDESDVGRIPNKYELFEIIKIGVENKQILGCVLENVEILVEKFKTEIMKS